jgi:hypothetical protein
VSRVALAPSRRDAPVGAPLTVIFVRQENVRREEDGPASSAGRGALVCALLRELPACGCGRADLVAAPRPEGSRPAGRGRPPAPESARCPPPRRATGSVPAPARALPRCFRVLRVRSWLGPDGLARRRRALEVVKKVVTASGRHRATPGQRPATSVVGAMIFSHSGRSGSC